VHPHDANTWDDERDGAAIREAVADGAVAIGECGLDNHYDHAPRLQQRRALDAQVALAAELGRPVVLHTRDAEADTVDMLREAASAGVQGVLHCFSGSVALAEAGLAAGWYVSFSGIITFKKFTDDALLRLVPEDRLLIESDAPYLAPVPHRGKRNESAYVGVTLARLAEARGTDSRRLGQQLVRNTCALFKLPSGIAVDDTPAVTE
jgi:TatD DNase family protein